MDRSLKVYIGIIKIRVRELRSGRGENHAILLLLLFNVAVVVFIYVNLIEFKQQFSCVPSFEL